ncbi:MAG: S8 family serine peptidase [Roseibacillus sp.]|nr:S8 family serine peptidase [Roseibacillus sp.]
MIAATRRALLSATILVVGLAAAAQADLLRYQAAIRSLGIGTANFRSVDARPALDAANPARAFAGGSFTDGFRIGPDPFSAVRSLNAEDGLLVGFTRIPTTKGWAVNWSRTVGCEEGNAVIHDVAIRFDGILLAGGTFEEKATFEREGQPPLELIAPTRSASFIALADPDSGEWLDAFVVPGMALRSMDVDDRGNIFVTGPGSLARRYSATFQQLWDIQPPNSTLSLDHIIVGRGEENPFVYVQGTFARQANDVDVFVVQMAKDTGDTRWTTPISSEGGHGERAGGIGIGPLGHLRVAVSSDGADLSVSDSDIRNKPTVDARHGHLLFLNRRDGKLFNDQILGRATEQGGILETQSLDIDYAGNTYVSVSFTGSYQFKGVVHPGREDAAVVVVDARGTPMRFMDSNGEAGATGLDVAVVGRDLQVLVGTMSGTTEELFGDSPLQPSAVNKAFLAVLDKPDDQDAYIITPATPDQELGPLIQVINRAEGEVYRVIDRPQRNIRLISANLTTEQVNSLLQAGARVEVDRELAPNGQINPAGWALGHLNNPMPRATDTYCYPETCQETILYLIDTGIDTSSGFFAGNPNLVISESIPVPGVGDPAASALDLADYDPASSAHGTEMLSMIAGPGTGAALGTPIRVISYDIYMGAPTTNISTLIEAVIQANTHKSLNHLYDPAAFCIASSSATEGSSPASLVSAIDYTLSPSVYATVLVSAGNTFGTASDYAPSDLGSKKGVICVGAIDEDNKQVDQTRGDPDIWAPGLNVAAVDVDGLLTTMSGTSASTALGTGAALIYLSANPVLTPDSIEDAMKDSPFSGPGGHEIVYVPESSSSSALNHMAYGDWASWHELDNDGEHNGTDTDEDGDGWTDKEEYFFLGSDPNSGTPGRDPFDSGSGVGYRNSILASVGNKQDEVTFEFPLSCILLGVQTLDTLSGPSALELRDGSELVIQRTADPADPGSWETWPNMDKLELYDLGPNTATMRFTVNLPDNAEDFYLYRVHVNP